MLADSKVGAHVQKVCAKCGADVSSQHRFKDAGGHYYCDNCYAPAAAKNAVNEPPHQASVGSLGLIPRVTCPHCWHLFQPHDVMWIASHSDLIGDAILGPEKASRFVPSRFTVDGQALDSRGVACQQLACPRCHLTLPRSSLESEPLFASIIGGPKTGKSYFLAAMTWGLRKQLPSAFAVAFNDADTVSNQHLNDYEATLFLPEDADKLVALAKTEETGELYDQVNLNGHGVQLPRPFLFNIRPTSAHFNAAVTEKVGRIICLYDNAGESFQPGKDTAASPVTQHLAKSRVLMFLFDPTQDPRFREKCRSLSHDPQLTGGRGIQRQETLLSEAGLRIRRHANLPPNKKYDRPLLVLVSKSDVWGPLLGEDVVTEPILAGSAPGRPATVDVRRVEAISERLRSLLLAETPELVSAAEDFCKHVVYIPISATGQSPQETPLPDGGTGLFLRPRTLSPHWVTVPVLYMFAKWTTGLIGGPVTMTQPVKTAKPSPA